MKHRLQLATVLSLALAVSACKGERSERVAASYSSATKATEYPLPKREPEAAARLDAVPAEEDYEVQAAASITLANLQAKVAELERELGL